MNYEPLTKSEIDEKGNQMIDCRLYGTDECRNIHMPKGCRNCPIFAAILIQLNFFENAYKEDKEE